jgi:hypothetical protein
MPCRSNWSALEALSAVPTVTGLRFLSGGGGLCLDLGFCPDNCPGISLDVSAGGSQLTGFKGIDLVGVAGFEPAVPNEAALGLSGLGFYI